MDGREPQIHEVWDFGSDGITRELQPNDRVYVGSGVVGELLSYCITESGSRIPLLDIISINGSVEHLGITDFHRTDGPFWAANILAPSYSWGDGGTTTNNNWGIKPVGPYRSAALPWSRPVPVCPSYVRRSLENTHAAVHRVRDNHLLSRRLTCMRSPSNSLNLTKNPRVNWRDDHREDPVDQ